MWEVLNARLPPGGRRPGRLQPTRIVEPTLPFTGLPLRYERGTVALGSNLRKHIAQSSDGLLSPAGRQRVEQRFQFVNYLRFLTWHEGTPSAYAIHRRCSAAVVAVATTYPNPRYNRLNSLTAVSTPVPLHTFAAASWNR